LFAAALATCAALYLPPSHAQYPSKPIRLIVPVAAGGSTDAVARIVAAQLSQAFGQAVVVENRAGADGAIAGDMVAKSAADGYTYLFGNATTLVGVPVLRKIPPYDPLTAFTPVSFLGRLHFFLYAHSSVPARSVQELIQYARANPGKLNYGTGNMISHLAMSQLMKSAGISLVHVPYKGEGLAIPDFIAGRFDVAFVTTGTVLNFVKDGRLRVLATLGDRRSGFAPEVPSMVEAGVPGAAVTGWNALFGPPKMPAEVVALMSQEINRILAKPDIRELFARQYIDAEGSTPEALAAILKEQFTLFARAAKDAGIQPD
jgi:tripartite-type tricarboxylate transporter receptor subunit TctC